MNRLGRSRHELLLPAVAEQLEKLTPRRATLLVVIDSQCVVLGMVDTGRKRCAQVIHPISKPCDGEDRVYHSGHQQRSDVQN